MLQWFYSKSQRGRYDWTRRERKAGTIREGTLRVCVLHCLQSGFPVVVWLPPVMCCDYPIPGTKNGWQFGGAVMSCL
eukprot:4438350-Amphidinium_carterae.1